MTRASSSKARACDIQIFCQQFSLSPASRRSTRPALPHVPSPEGTRGLRVQDTSPGRTCRRRRGVCDASAIADLGAAPTSPPGGVCEHGFHPFPDLGRLASLDILWAGSAGLQGRHRATGPPGQRTDEADTYGWTSRPRALEPAVGVMNRLPHAQGPGQDRWSLHIAGLNNTGCAIRLHRMGQAGRAYAGRDRDVPLWELCRFGWSRPLTHRSFTPIHNSPF